MTHNDEITHDGVYVILGVPALFQGHVFLPQPAFFQMPLIGSNIGSASSAYANLMQHASAYHQSLTPTRSTNDYFIESLSKSHDSNVKIDDDSKRKAAAQTNASLMNIYHDDTYQLGHTKRPVVDIDTACHYHQYPQQHSVDHRHLIDSSTSAR